MFKRAAASALVIAALVPAVASAQGSLAGKWTTEFDIGIRNENGVETSMGKRKATITLTVTGDSVTGTWQPEPGPSGAPPAAIKLRGTIKAGHAIIVSDAVERTVRVNDDELKVSMVTTYDFNVHGDKLDGTSHLGAVDGSMDGSTRPFTAERSKP